MRENRLIARKLIHAARRAVDRGRDLCLMVQERRRHSDFFCHLARYAEEFPKMRRYLPLSGGEADPLRIEAEERPEGLVVRVSGEVDLGTATLFREAFRPAVTDSRNIILDVSALKYIDSTGFHTLVDAHRALHRRKRHVIVVGATRGIARVVRVLRLDALLPVLPSIEEAVEFLRAHPASATSDC